MVPDLTEAIILKYIPDYVKTKTFLTFQLLVYIETKQYFVDFIDN